MLRFSASPTARAGEFTGIIKKAVKFRDVAEPELSIEDRFKLWATLRAAKSVGGDLYTFQLQSGRRLFFAVGDVSDKGVPAALFMARAMTLLQQ